MRESLRRSLAERIHAVDEATDKRTAQGIAIESFLFGQAPPPSDEHKAVRDNILARFSLAQREFGEGSAAKLMSFLRKMAKEYEPAKHGISQWMTMLDDIDALREEEQEARSGAS